MLQLKIFGVVALCSISSAPTALLLILIWVSELVKCTKLMFVTHVRRFGIILAC